MGEEVEVRLVAAAHVAGPLLLFLASCAFLADLPGWEGVLGFYGAVVVTPALLSVARQIGPWYPRYSVLCQGVSVLGGFAVAFGFGMRAVYVALRRAGLVQGGFDDVMAGLFSTASNPEVGMITAVGAAFPAALVLIGAGLWRAEEGAPATSGPLLVASGLLYVLAEVAGVAQAITWPACFVCLLGALAPVGWPALQR